MTVMSRNWQHRLIGFAALSLSVATFLPVAAAQNDAEPAPATEAAPATESSPKADVYTVPKSNDTAAIKAYIAKVANTPAPDNTPAGIRDHFSKIEKIAETLIARPLEAEATLEAIRLKIAANGLMQQFGDQAAIERKQEFLAKLKQDPRPEIAVHGRLLDVEGQATMLQPDDNKTAQQLIDQTVELLKEKPLTDAHVSVAFAVAEAIELNASDKLATTAYQVFAKYLKTSDDPGHVAAAETFEGSARRLNLIGNPIKIAGKTLEGTDFNIDQWKGKVVLIDFWATWCPPCVEELPAIKELREKYGPAGFEVVGINLDDNIDRVGTFVTQNGFTWPHIISEKGQDNPLANYYGVYQLPTTFLVGRDGKVTDIDIYGDELAEEVAKRVGAKLAPKTP